ncbi:cobaltochelatase subunit CobN [Flexibacterium corallicola]|uniref:cobaltochelatase subunit CobN n=1 Tax=Flexibacterium corallicola TaxID=3037259 RepID=UPI00286F446D|nr:cobaltochelatase subunit CobN [Pseudovibrio sp. M1P-2-3]
MHILAGQTRRIDEGDEAVDLAQSPADIVVLSSADTELAGFAQAFQRGGHAFSLRLASLLALSHPFSVDLYTEQTLLKSKMVIARLLGGADYWTYGVERLEELARGYGLQTVFIPGDDKWDETLAKRSSVPLDVAHRIWRYCVEGGPDNLHGALHYAAHSLKLVSDEPEEARPLPKAGLYLAGHAVPSLADLKGRWGTDKKPVAALVFYRALLQGGAMAPVEALVNALHKQGVNALPIYVSSLKDAECAQVVTSLFEQANPDVVVNATAFALSKAGQEHSGTILDAPQKPVLQVIFSSASQEGWAESNQGLSTRDLAMHVVLPELDGRLLSRAVSFKEEGVYDEATQSTPVRFVPKADRMEFVAQLTANWAALGANAVVDKKVVIVLANYPNKDGRLGNGVGLDTPASCINVLRALDKEGYHVEGAPKTSGDLMDHLLAGPTNALGERKDGEILSLSHYNTFFEELPEAVKQKICERWGAPENDPHVKDAGFQLAIHGFGNVSVGIQPARGYNIDPKETYHDPDLVPPHHYFAWYFWVRHVMKAHAVIHLGKHGNLEWLPGKALALSEECFPEAALGPMPNIYPFIVNDPGEGAQAKRRNSAVIVDHLTPPLSRAESHGAALELENLLDEFYLASGVDPRRMKVLIKEILNSAARHGLDKDIGITVDMDEETQLARLDAHLCDLKEMQIRDGLHILGESPRGALLDDLKQALVRISRGKNANDNSILRALVEDLDLKGFDPLDCPFELDWTGSKPEILAGVLSDPWRSNGDTVERLELLAAGCINGSISLPHGFTATAAVLEELESKIGPAVEASGEAEISAALTALAGGFVPPGPSGAPTRGRPDVLPTGRNFYSVDVRSVPTPTAWDIGSRSAAALVLRHFQEEGEWPTSLVLSCWGTANMRTGGDDIAQALALIGAAPVWEAGSGRVTGFDVIPLSKLERPRVDVTLRISGFFRDAFPQLVSLFDSAVRAVSELDEPAEANPIAARVQNEAAQLQAKGVEPKEAQRRASLRVYGSKPGAYGAGLQALIDERIWTERSDFAEAFLEWGGYGYGAGVQGVRDKDGLSERLKTVDVVAHNQDNREHDLLDSDDYYQFEGGLAATVETLKGEAPKVYHNDHSRPERPVIRSLSEEIGRVVRGRAANPKWIAGVMRHGYKGAFEMSATLDYLFAFGATTNAVENHHFDQLHEAYLVNEEVQAFLRENNTPALLEMTDRFLEAIERGLWNPRRNSAHYDLLALQTELKGANYDS